MPDIPSEEWFDDFVFNLWDPDLQKRAEKIAQYREFPRDQVNRLLRKFLQSPMDGLVWKAAYLLLHENREEHLSVVLEALKSPLVDVRWVICGVLHDLSVSGASEALEAIAENDPVGRVRFAAVSALGRCGSEKSIQVLERIAEKDKGDDGQGRPIAPEARSTIASLRERFS